MAIFIVDFPINSMVIFHSFLYVYQRVICEEDGCLVFQLPSWNSIDSCCSPAVRVCHHSEEGFVDTSMLGYAPQLGRGSMINHGYN